MSSTDLVPLPDGQLVDLGDPSAVAVAIHDLRNLESRIKEAKASLVNALEEYITHAGKGKTVDLPGGVRVVLKNDKELLWDAQQLEADLRAAEMSEERIREIVIEEVSYKVSANEARKAASVNALYAVAVNSARKEIPKRPSVTIERA